MPPLPVRLSEQHLNHGIFNLQRTVGNQAVIRRMNSLRQSTQPAVDRSGDTVTRATTCEWMDPDDIDYSRKIGDSVGTFEAPNAGSACNIFTGEYEIKFNDNQTCTRDCSTMHEQRHQFDLGPCCKAAAARVAAGADARQTQIDWNNWVTSGAGPWSECNAHAISVSCGQSVQSFNNCDSVSSQCCSDANYYVYQQKRAQKVACLTAPPDKPDCPFGT